MGPYKALFAEGTRVRVKDSRFLADFRAGWKFHHKLTDEMMPHAGQETVVKGVGYYHGGDCLYTLTDVPGTWHEACLESA